jgi:ketosteroid isomerase-like protein
MSQSGFATPEEAEQAFYRAFQNADLQLMTEVWAERDFVECIHPMADRAYGHAQVLDSWRRIFAGGLRVRLQLSEVHRTHDALLAIHVVYEHLRVPGQASDYPPIIATNVYQLLETGWFMIHHHASPSTTPEHEDQPETVTGAQPGDLLH